MKIEDIKTPTETDPKPKQIQSRVKLVKYKILITRHLRQNAKKQQKQQQQQKEKRREEEKHAREKQEKSDINK